MYQLNEEQKELKKLTSEFVKNVVEDGANERNNTNSFSEEIFKQIGEMGYLGVTIPAVYGGCEMDYVASTIIINEIAKSDASLAHLVSCCNYTLYPY
ncbi:acyl-CoA dehydrogenase family protein [Cellulosilyticum ruminicola]|uniref:acyl-CoA dehydrogenase family protein n=1 Tax=Cellulosilyticum ruminicola TaxID=425254 RepID=UPI0006D1F35D|nr:acyl-CoA dehydrogenase family protein [Cellulosilyticum ruminicola]